MYRIYVLEEAMASMLLDPKPQEDLLPGVGQEIIKAFRAKSPKERLEIYLAIVKQLQVIHDEFKMVINQLEPSDIMVASAENMVPKIVDFSAIGGVSAAVYQHRYYYTDSETNDVMWSSVINDVYGLGLCLSEIELGKLMAKDAWDVKPGMRYIFRQKRLQQTYHTRDAIIEKLKAEQPWTTKFDKQSFHKLLREMTKVRREKRMPDLKCAVAWLEYLIPAHAGSEELAKSKRGVAAQVCGHFFGVKMI